MARRKSPEREQVEQMRAEVEAALAKIGKKHGSVFVLGNITFTGGNAWRAKVESVPTKSEPGFTGKDPNLIKLENDMVRHGYKFNLSEKDLGTKFVAHGTTYTVIGLKPRSYKYPVIATSPTGKMYKFKASIVIANR